MLDVKKFVAELQDYIAQTVAPLVEQLDRAKAKVETLEKKLAEIQLTPGPKGDKGKDADPVEITHDDILTAIKSDPVMMRDVVTEYLKANPPAPGKDGVNLAGAMIDKNGELIVTLSNGELQRCGVVVGKDGADLSDVEFDYDGERTIEVRAKGGTVVKRYTMPVVIDKGYWRDGCSAEKGDAYTHDGNWWIALKSTTAKPSAQAKDDWRMGARKGRDGRDGKAPPQSGPVTLKDDKGGDDA